MYSKAITLKRITSTLYALFTLYAFSNQFSLTKVTIDKQVVLQEKQNHFYKNYNVVRLRRGLHCRNNHVWKDGIEYFREPLVQH